MQFMARSICEQFVRIVPGTTQLRPSLHTCTRALAVTLGERLPGLLRPVVRRRHYGLRLCNRVGDGKTNGMTTLTNETPVAMSSTPYRPPSCSHCSTARSLPSSMPSKSPSSSPYVDNPQRAASPRRASPLTPAGRRTSYPPVGLVPDPHPYMELSQPCYRRPDPA